MHTENNSLEVKLEKIALSNELPNSSEFVDFIISLNEDRKIFAEITFVAPISAQAKNIVSLEKNLRKVIESLETLLETSKFPSGEPSHAEAFHEIVASPFSETQKMFDELSESHIESLIHEMVHLKARAAAASIVMQNYQSEAGRKSAFEYKFFLSKLADYWNIFSNHPLKISHSREPEYYHGIYFDFVREIHKALCIRYQSNIALGRNIHRSFSWRNEANIKTIGGYEILNKRDAKQNF